MILVQYVEFFGLKKHSAILCFEPFKRPLSRVLSSILCVYLIVIYIHHFKRPVRSIASKALHAVTTIGNMTKPEMSDIRYFSPYLL